MDVWMALAVLSCVITSLYSIYIVTASMMSVVNVKVVSSVDDLGWSLVSVMYYVFWIVVVTGELTSNLLFIVEAEQVMDFGNIVGAPSGLLVMKCLGLSLLFMMLVLVWSNMYRSSV